MLMAYNKPSVYILYACCSA